MPRVVLYFILAGLGYLTGADLLENTGCSSMHDGGVKVTERRITEARRPLSAQHGP